MRVLSRTRRTSPRVVGQRLTTLRDGIPIFQGADEEQLREIYLSVRVLEFEDREVIVRQSDHTDSFLVITEGQVRISKRAEDGTEALATELQAGNFFGEMGLVSGRRRNATAIASRTRRIRAAGNR